METKPKQKTKETKNNKYHTDKIITSPIISTRSHVRFILFYFSQKIKNPISLLSLSIQLTFAQSIEKRIAKFKSMDGYIYAILNTTTIAKEFSYSSAYFQKQKKKKYYDKS